MQLKPFLLDMWLDNYEHEVDFNLAASTGPSWTLHELLDLAGEEERRRFLGHDLVYSRPAGADGLREAIAEMQGVRAECVQIVTGASEALLVLMWMAAEPGANVIVPRPGFTTFPRCRSRWVWRPAFTEYAKRTISALMWTRS